jgi:hypothetical protein
MEPPSGPGRRAPVTTCGFEETVSDLKKRFTFMGDTGAYFFLYVVGEDMWWARRFPRTRNGWPGTEAVRGTGAAGDSPMQRIHG